MKNFEFSLPTKVIFGRDAQTQAGAMAAALGHRALIVYGSRRAIDNGLMNCVTQSLQKAGIVYELFGGISPNPLLSEAKKVVKAALAFQADMLLAVGGGSVIDATKAASLGCLWEGELWELYTGERQPKAALPVGVILTVAATASEMNCVSVLQHDAYKMKAALTCPLTYPAFALMNPELTFSVSPQQTAIGAADIFSHGFERYFHKEQRGTLRNYLCEAVMKTVIEELPKALKKPDSYEARSQLMWTAAIAHNDSLGKEGVYVCHAMSHVLTTVFGIPHGMALGMLMPAWCKFVMVRHPEDIAGFAANVWGVDAANQSADSAAQEGIFRFQQFICNSGLPVTLREAGIKDADSAALAKCLMAGKPFIGENYEKFDKKDIQAMFDLAIG